jgi:hypothetical protein
MPHGCQLGFDSAMAIDPIQLMVDGAVPLAQTPIRHLSRQRWTLPGIKNYLTAGVLKFPCLAREHLSQFVFRWHSCPVTGQ